MYSAHLWLQVFATETQVLVYDRDVYNEAEKKPL